MCQFDKFHARDHVQVTQRHDAQEEKAKCRRKINRHTRKGVASSTVSNEYVSWQ